MEITDLAILSAAIKSALFDLTHLNRFKSIQIICFTTIHTENVKKGVGCVWAYSSLSQPWL